MAASGKQSAPPEKETGGREEELSAGRESVLAAYDDLIEAREHFRNAARAAGMDLRDEALEQWLEGRERAGEFGARVRRYVEEKPLASMGIAFVAGIVFSRFISRN